MVGYSEQMTAETMVHQWAGLKVERMAEKWAALWVALMETMMADYLAVPMAG